MDASYMVLEFFGAVALGWVYFQLKQQSRGKNTPKRGTLIRLRGEASVGRCRFLRKDGERWFITPPIQRDRVGLFRVGEKVIAEAIDGGRKFLFRSVIEVADPEKGLYALRGL